MSDQVEGMIRDSDIKFECRLLLVAIKMLDLDKELEEQLMESLYRIIKIENNRLDKIGE